MFPDNSALGVFPNVPDLPGVPPLQRKITSAAIAGGALYVKDVFKLASGPPAWGVFDSQGKLFLEPDSFLGIRYRNQNQISDYPVEEGAFATYNKVQTPFDAMVSLAKGGTRPDRVKFLKNVEAMFADINLYQLITPELTYPDVSVEDYDYERRTRNGAHMIVAHIHFKQVRILPNPGQYAQPKPTQHKGQVAATTLPQKVLAATALTPILSW